MSDTSIDGKEVDEILLEKLNATIEKNNELIKALNTSTLIANIIMIVLTVGIFLLTAVMLFKR